MKKPTSLTGSLTLLLLTMLLSPGCAVVGGIFKAGIWVGILAVVFIVVIIMFIVGKAKK